MKKLIAFVFFYGSFFMTPSFAQELFCRVGVDASVIQSSGNQSYLDQSFTSSMEQAFREFLNDRAWTDLKFKTNERLRCNFVIRITEVPALGDFRATAQFQAVRPVHGSSYETVVFNFIDKNFDFQYQIGQPLEYNENAYLSSISSLLAYFALTTIGMDFDSFSKLGGTPYFNRALNIVNAAQQAPVKGWTAFSGGSNSRYWYNENLLNQQMEPFREAVFIYHRQGLDQMATKPEEAREKIYEALKLIKRSNDLRPGSVLIRSFLEAKADEIVSIFKKAPQQMKTEVSSMMAQMDPAHADKYRKMN